MAQGFHAFLLFVIIGTYSWHECKALPVPVNNIVRVQGPEDSWPEVYPESFVTIGGTYGDANSLLVFKADGVYNGHPIYKSKSQGWTIYYRKAGYWVRDFNAVGEEWAGTVGIKRDGLFSANV